MRFAWCSRPGPFPSLCSRRWAESFTWEPSQPGCRFAAEIVVRETGSTFSTGPGERNADGVAHATVVAVEASTWTVSFEDAIDGDFDLNDVVFQVRPLPPLSDRHLAFHYAIHFQDTDDTDAAADFITHRL